MKLVCLDTHYFTWALLERCKTGQEDMIPKAKAFFQHLDQTRAIIVVPTPVVVELLMEAEATEQDKVLKVLEEKFHVKEFDKLAAKHAANIWNQKKRSGLIDELKKSGVSIRTKIKVDTLILGTAMAENVPVLYSEDRDFCKLAEGFITVSEMPAVEIQPDLVNFPELKSAVA